MYDCKKIVVTGGAGTCGDRIVRQLLSDKKHEEVWSIDNNEGNLFFQRESLKGYKSYRASLVDIRDKRFIDFAFSEADVVIHCAAYKNVPMCEISPSSCVSTNITGTENIISSAISKNVKKVLFTSSDKAVNPTNIMGATKFVGEKLVTAANLHAYGISETIFASTRFGNVVGSTGSVLPIFLQQLKSLSALTITDKMMTRFMMSQKSAADLVIASVEKAKGGELFITKMPVINLDVFAKAIFSICEEKNMLPLGSKFESFSQYIGARPGEKMYEELMSHEERPRTKEVDDFFVVMPPEFDVYGMIDTKTHYDGFHNPERTYNSDEEPHLDFVETKNFIYSVLEDDELDFQEIK